MRRPFPSPGLAWLKEGYLGEYDSGLGPPLALHIRGRTAKAAAPLVERAARIVDSRHILWVVERDLHAPPGRGHGLPVRKDKQGRPIRHAVEWVQPFHEGVKRIAPRFKGIRARDPRVQRAALLRYWLGARGFTDASIVHVLTIATGWRDFEVTGAIERAGRDALALIGDERAGPLPEGVYSGRQKAGGARLAPRLTSPRGQGRGALTRGQAEQARGSR